MQLRKVALCWAVGGCCWILFACAAPGQIARNPAFVLELAFEDRLPDGRTRESTALGVTAAGDVFVPQETLQGLVPADRLAAERLSELLAELDQQGRLREIDSARLADEVRRACQLSGFQPEIEGSGATIIRARFAAGPVEVRCDGLSVMAARFPDFPELQRLLAMQLRLQNVAAVARAGGEQASLQLAAVANRTLQASRPELPPLTVRDLSMVRSLASGSRYVQFYRSPTRTSEELLVSLFETPGQPPQVSVLTSPSQATP